MVNTELRLSVAQQKELRRVVLDPVLFARQVLHLQPYDKQEEILRKIASGRKISIVGANGVGKDWTLGAAVIPWWFASHRPAVCVVLGPTHKQIHDIVWRELKGALSRCALPFGGKMYETDRWELDNENFAVGLATDEPFNLQGYHSQNLLAICSEAHGLTDEHIEAMERLNPSCLVLSGNPLTMGGKFYESHHNERHLWDTVEISAFDSPNVKGVYPPLPGLITARDIEDRKAAYGESNPYYQAAVLGQWPASLSDACLSLDLVMAATRRELRPFTPEVLACDVASSGADKTVVWHRRGPVIELAHRAQGQNPMATVGWLANYMMEHPNIDTLIVDAVHDGFGVVPRLREKGIAVVPFNGGGRPWGMDAARKYKDRNTECWMNLAAELRAGNIQIPNDRALVSQLVSRKVAYTSDGIKVESKHDMKPPAGMGRAAWQSPDEADAMVMLFGPLTGGRGTAKVVNLARRV